MESRSSPFPLYLPKPQCLFCVALLTRERVVSTAGKRGCSGVWMSAVPGTCSDSGPLDVLEALELVVDLAA